MDPRTRTEEIALLERRIKESGLETGPFARDVLIREPRTVRRWLDSSSPIPKRVLEWLRDPPVAPWPLFDVDVTIGLGQDRLDEIARLLDDPDLAHDERILLVSREGAKRPTQKEG